MTKKTKTAEPELFSPGEGPKVAPLTEGTVRKGGRNITTQVTNRPPPPAPANATPVPQNMLAVLAQATTNPAVDVAKMQALLDMQATLEKEQARRSFTEAFVKMQAELPEIRADGRIEIREKDNKGNRTGVVQQSTPYATFQNIWRVLRPILSKYGFALSYPTEPGSDGRILVHGILDHVDGHQRMTTFPLPAETSGSKNNVQGWGSSLSYGKRYATISLLNIISNAKMDEDRDGNDEQAPIEPVAVKLISAEDVDVLSDKIKLAGLTTARFCTRFNIQQIADLPDDRYDEAVAAIEKYGAEAAQQQAKDRK